MRSAVSTKPNRHQQDCALLHKHCNQLASIITYEFNAHEHARKTNMFNDVNSKIK